MSKTVSLVLGSGGARGLAHIGVIEELEKKGFKIGSISGSSMGAFVGGIYAKGELNVYKDWVCELDKLDVFKLIDFTFSTQGFIRGERIITEIMKIIEDCRIEQLSIPFAAVATDIVNKKEVVFTSGSLFRALRASIAIPTVLTPISIDNVDLVDGGVINPIPIEHVERTTGDLLVVVNVNANKPYLKNHNKSKEDKIRDAERKNLTDIFKRKWQEFFPANKTSSKKLGFFELMNRSIDLMQDRLTDTLLDRYQPDIQVNISRDACSTFEFYKAKEMIEEGKRALTDSLKKHSMHEHSRTEQGAG
ncbi:patatin-like phospholipase family protein [Fulvivirgaceae bacterium BMA10]|uniref:Patatin-like phospholipase family protein n=1 Tax=Splendidivirga corallicola TaxID=3051826 RepID=A0ABT8KQK7_9BACT|nr:patatin-like phospholipase family protein [Fulvivirgaceae bacterium BMA10]